MNVEKEGPEETEIFVPFLCTKPEGECESECVCVFSSQTTAYHGAAFIGKKPYLQRFGDAESSPKTSQCSEGAIRLILAGETPHIVDMLLMERFPA